MSPATILVIFGASGDLTRRKLIPALFELHRKGRLPEGFRLLGAARSPATDDTFREQSRQGLQTFAPESFDEAAWGPFAARLHYLEGDFAVNEESGRLARRLAEIGGDGGSSNLLFYLATPPQAYTSLVDALAAVGLPVERDGGGPASPPPPCPVPCARTRSPASTTPSAKRPSRTSWSCASPTASSSRSGIATTSITSRSPPPRRSGSSTAAASTTRSVCCETSSRI